MTFEELERGHRDLCLRVSQNHDAYEKQLATLNNRVSSALDERIGNLETSLRVNDRGRDDANITRIARDEVHATRCELAALTYRVSALETALQVQREAYKIEPQPRGITHATTAEGVVHNFSSADGDGSKAATVQVGAMDDSRGLSICINGSHVRGQFLIIPWALIDKKRLEYVQAKTAPRSEVPPLWAPPVDDWLKQGQRDYLSGLGAAAKRVNDAMFASDAAERAADTWSKTPEDGSDLHRALWPVRKEAFIEGYKIGHGAAAAQNQKAKAKF